MDIPFPILRAHPVFHTRSLDESRSITSRMWERHQVSMPRSGSFETTIHGFSGGGMGISHVDCKTALHMECGPVGDTYYLYIPLAGEVAHAVNGREAVCRAETAVIHAPGQVVRMEATPVRMMIVTLDRKLLAGCLASGGLPTYAMEEWGLSIELSSSNGRKLADACLRAARDLDSVDSPTALEGPFAHLRAQVCGHLVATLGDMAPDWKPTRDAWLGVCSLDDLVAWLRANAARPVGLADLVARSGVSARSVQKAFLRHYGCGPNRFITNLRLDEAQRRIVSRPQQSIVNLAHELGFAHPGRFAAAYLRRFGEYPTETRKRWST